MYWSWERWVRLNETTKCKYILWSICTISCDSIVDKKKQIWSGLRSLRKLSVSFFKWTLEDTIRVFLTRRADGEEWKSTCYWFLYLTNDSKNSRHCLQQWRTLSHLFEMESREKCSIRVRLMFGIERIFECWACNCLNCLNVCLARDWTPL